MSMINNRIGSLLLVIAAAMPLQGCNTGTGTQQPASAQATTDTAISEMAAQQQADAPAPTVDFDAKMREYGLVDVATLDSTITIDLKYATTDNFVGKDMYCGLHKAYLTEKTAQMLIAALHELQKIDPDYSFIIYDAARPQSVQRTMWAIVEGTAQEDYVAKPHKGGAHNFGIAVDMSITYRGKPIDMGTPFDNFTEAAHITNEKALVREGRISEQARQNRELLRRVLKQQGFNPLSNEWWHFTSCSINYARKHLRLLDF